MCNRTEVAVGLFISLTGRFRPPGPTGAPKYSPLAVVHQCSRRHSVPNGKKRSVRLIWYGDRSQISFARKSVFQLLREDKIDIFLGPYSSSLTMAVVEIAEEYKKAFCIRRPVGESARRVVAKVEFHAGELFPRVGFIVTNLETPSRAAVRFYNKRGTAEQWIKEDKQAVKMTRLSCHRFRSNHVRLALSLLAYNLGNLWRRLALSRRICIWTPGTLLSV